MFDVLASKDLKRTGRQFGVHQLNQQHDDFLTLSGTCFDDCGVFAATQPHGQPGQKDGHGKKRGREHLQQETIRERHGQRTRGNRQQRKHF